MTNNIECFITCIANFLSNLYPKLEFEGFLRTKGQAAGGAKELRSKLLVQIPTLGVSYSKPYYKGHKTFAAVSHNFWVPTQYNFNN